MTTCILLIIFGFCSGMAITLLAWWLDDRRQRYRALKNLNDVTYGGQIDGEESDDDWNCDDEL